MDRELVLPDGELLHVLGQAAHHPGAIAVHGVGLGGVLVTRVDDGGLEPADVRLAALGARVGGVPGHGDDVLRRGRGQVPEPAAGGGRRGLRGLQGRGQRPASTDPAGHLRLRGG